MGLDEYTLRVLAVAAACVAVYAIAFKAVRATKAKKERRRVEELVAREKAEGIKLAPHLEYAAASYGEYLTKDEARFLAEVIHHKETKGPEYGHMAARDFAYKITTENEQMDAVRKLDFAASRLKADGFWNSSGDMTKSSWEWVGLAIYEMLHR